MEQPTHTSVHLLENALLAVNHFFRSQEDFVQGRHDISRLEMDILLLICRHGAMKMKEIAAHYNLKLSTLTSVVNKAEAREILRRQSSPEDRRVVLVAATKIGKDIYEDYTHHMRYRLASLLEELNPEHQSDLFNGFQTFLSAYHK